MYEYLTNCVDAVGDDIGDMVEQAVEVEYREFEHHIGIDVLVEMFGNDVPLSKDWSVSFWKSKYLGDDVYYIDHSRIEYIFRKEM